VLQAGGFPLELPAISLSESFVKPTTMLYRNLLAMETEELLRSHPVDGAVLMGGCDKTTPGLLMGASQHGPALHLPAGRPDAARQLAGQVLGSGSTPGSTGTSAAPATSPSSEWLEIEGGIARSHGTCMTMGTAATMMGIAEALGLTLPGRQQRSRRRRQPPAHGRRCGRRIVDMVWEDLTPAACSRARSFDNGITVAMAMGCSHQRHHPPGRHGAPRRHCR
jgi:dihydroxyacid dehydratase/phosphogluconate dehydratase